MPRLSVTNDPIAAPVPPDAGEGAGAVGSPVHFRSYTNYAHWIDHAEVRIFEKGQSVKAEPLAVAPVDAQGNTEWQPEATWFASPVRELQYVLRAYDKEGHFDEVRRQELICAGHYESVERQECVTPGHWETCDRRASANDSHDNLAIDLSFIFR